ncbi:MAG: S49 family peptidase, partial [Polyangiaceae bacterium]|nr:S49 family peptidase [Polyangiaceae bacterium]
MHTNRFSSLNRRQLVNPTMKAGATIPKRSSRLSLFLRSNHRLAPIVLSVCLGSLSLLGGQAAAQTTKQRPLPLPAEGRSIVSNGDSTTLVQNPANLALLPGPELRWTGQYLNEDVEIPARGNSAAVALPFGFIPIAMGLRYDMVNPPARAANQMAGDEFKYQWLTWGMSLGNEVSSIGVSYQHSYSKNALYDGWDAWNLGWTTHPMDYFGVSFIAERVNRPLNELGIALDRNYAFGTVIRPTGTSAFEIGLEGNYVDAPTGYWMPRATASFAVPYFGRVRGDVTWIDPGENAGASSWTASTALVVDINSRVSSAQLSLGTRYGTSLGSDQEVYQDLTGEVAIRGFREPDGAENVPYALTIRLERTPSNREHTQLLRSLWEMANVDRNLRAVLLELRAAPANSLAHLQELQDAIELLRSRGKQVVCSLESADGSSMYLCSSANKVLINPAGGIRYAGLKTQSFYLKGLLDKLGVQTDFVRIGRHKSAPEMFVRSEATQTAASDRAILLQQI